MHSPTSEAARREGQRRGGASTARRRAFWAGAVDFSEPGEVRMFFEHLAKAVLRGELPPQRALAASQIGEAALRVRAGVELEGRLDLLESRIVGLTERHSWPGGGETP